VKDGEIMSVVKDLIGTSRRKDISFVDYCREYFVLDDGAIYDPLSRPFMREIVETYDSHPHLTIEKGAQTGFSTLAIAHSLYMVDIKEKNIIYYLPTDKMAKMFGPTRFDPYIDRSTYLKERLQGTDQAGLKQIGTHFLYVLGLFGKAGAISIPADEIKFDEVALINPENMELAQDRISAPGSLGWQKYFSVALFPEDGIDELFERSDKRKWLVKCAGCRYEAPIEEDFPENMAKTADGMKLVCPKCGKVLDVGTGQWVPEQPDRIDRRGYRVPQLIIPDANLNLIWSRWETARDKPSKRARFRRSVLSLPDSGNMQPVSPEVLRRLEAASGYYFADYSEETTGIGIDMGDKAHVAVVAPYKDGGIRPLAFWEVEVEDLDELVARIEIEYNAGGLVIDAMPYKTESKKIVRNLKKATGYIQYFKGTELKEGTEGEDDRMVRKVTVERDESLDETTDLFAVEPPLALLPKPRTIQEEEIIKMVKSHLLKLVKEEIVGEGGEKQIRYKKNVDNHFGMALNSARIALELTKYQVTLTPGNILTAAKRKMNQLLRGYDDL
jgi:hypothetical protein